MMQVNRKEMDNPIIDIGRRDAECVKNAAVCEPVYTLKEILDLKNTGRLKQLAGLVHVKGYTKMDKEQLLGGLCERFSKAEVMTEILHGMERVQWAFFQKVAEKKQSTFARANYADYEILQGAGLLQTFAWEDKLVFVVPKEIRAVYRQLKKTDFAAQKEYENLLDDYALAATRLYGFISQDEFVAIFNSQNERQTTIDEAFEILIRYACIDAPYSFYDEYIVSEAFEENEYEDVLPWAKAIADKPRYIPDREEFLRYADWTYYEETPQVQALRSFFVSEEKRTRRDANELVDNIHDLCEQGVRMQVIIDMLDDRGVTLEREDAFEKFAMLYTEMHNHTRIWLNKGHTPDEIFRQYRPAQSPVRRATKVGRNDPCPCGSGKKYKKCCGLLS